MPPDFRQNLATSRELHSSILAALQNLDPSQLVFRAPVIDRSNAHGWRQLDVSGWQKMVQSVEKQAAQLDALEARPGPLSDDPLPNVLSLQTFYKQILLARPPIAAVRATMKGKAKEEAFVDIIARGGAEWIKLWTKKDRQLVSEFKEMDSYVNSDWESEGEQDEMHGSGSYTAAGGSTSGGSGRNGNGEAEKALTNSLIEAVEQLLSVAQHVERPPGAKSPQITVRVTRMEEFPADGHLDERIPATFEAIRRRGVNLVFGDLTEEEVPIRPRSSTAPIPALKVNLDPTALIGLCSDLLHYSLPADKLEAGKRFLRPSRQDDDTATDEPRATAGQSKNSRELYKEVLEEMERPLIEELRNTLEEAVQAARNRAEASSGVEFWATKESVRHLREAMCSEEVIGEGMEQRRMRRLIGLEEGDFFEGSRYEGKEGVLRQLRLHVFDDVDPNLPRRPLCEDGMRSFHESLAAICGQFLREYYASTTDPDYPADSLPAFLRPDRLPTPKVAQLSLPFPIVSLHAFRRGAEEGMTTLSLGNIVFRELFSSPRWRLKGWAQGSYEREDAWLERGGGSGGNAAVWMMPYRSFGEGKRVRFEKGDYSFPSGPA